MNIAITIGHHDYVVDASPDATVADLCAALPDTPECVWIDGRKAPGHRLVSSIPNGAILDERATPQSPAGRYREGKVSFNRPPRVGRASPPAPPGRPVPPDVQQDRARFGWATVAISVIAGAVSALLFGPALAVFSLLGAVMAAGSWLEAWMTARRERRAAREDYARALARYATDRAQWERRRLAALRSQMPEPAIIIGRALGIDSVLWERRPVHEDFGLVSVGVEPDGAPSGIRLAKGVTVGIAGDRAAATGLLRWILVQAVVLHGPADLSVRAPTTPDWDWLKWLPHAERGAALSVRVGDRAPEPFDGAEVVIAETTAALPGDCHTLIDLRGQASVTRVDNGARRRITPIVVSEQEAFTVSRALARLQDPEDRTPDGGPATLGELLGFPTPEAIVHRWRAAARLQAPIGYGPAGPLIIDLVADGPHGLLAGTTGSGKSELLRTLVLSFAASVPPSRLGFVLIDYKGGSTFDACADLPHVVGTLTDLDATSAQRGLEGLEAELRERESLLRADRAEDLASYRGTRPIPHLLIIVDEFAALAEQAPATLDGLIDIARRGRSLGMHLLLATQRPAGVISDRIRANTALRICLRVHDPADSSDVVGVADAARIARSTPGRGFLRLGPGELVAFQAALATTRQRSAKVRIARFVRSEPLLWQEEEEDGLAPLAETIRSAALLSGEVPLPRVWSSELPATVHLSELDFGSSPDVRWATPFGLIDDPRGHRVVWWEATNVLFAGLDADRTSRALVGLATAICSSHPQAHVHAIGAFGERFQVLDGLPQVGTIVASGDVERQLRLLRYLVEIIEQRRHDGGGTFPILLLADGVPVGDEFRRVCSEGPEVGVFAAAVVRSAGSIGGELLSAFPERFAFALADPYEYAALGLGRAIRPTEDGALRIAEGRSVRIVEPADDTGVVPAERPVKIGALPQSLAIHGIGGGAVRQQRAWFFPIGVGGRSVLRPAGFRLARGRHGVITGKRGSGKTTALETLARIARGCVDLAVLGDLDATGVRIDEFGALAGPKPMLCLIDDADRLDLDLRNVPVNVHLVAAATTSRLEYGHWLRAVIPDAEGLVLQPDYRDEELWRVRLEPTALPGRGFLISGGDPLPIQVASGTMIEQREEDNASSDRNRRHTA